MMPLASVLNRGASGTGKQAAMGLGPNGGVVANSSFGVCVVLCRRF